MEPHEHVPPLRIDELRDAVNRVLDAAVTRFGPTVGLDAAGPYWHLPWDTAYAVDHDAGLRLVIGDTLEDNVPAMLDVLRPEVGEEQPLSFALGRLAELFRWLAFLDAPREWRERRDSVTDAEVLGLLRKQWTDLPHSNSGNKQAAHDQG